MKLFPASAAAWLAAALCAPACAPPPPLPERTLPLAGLADLARFVTETESIDIGTEEGRTALWSGWGPNEPYPEGTFAWGAGERSLLRFDLVEPRDRTLRLRGWSFPFGDEPAQEVRVRLNGHEIVRRLLAPDPDTFAFELPAAAQLPGENWLELAYARHAVSGQPWAAAWDGLRLESSGAAAVARIEPGDGALVLPARSAIEWTLDLPGGSWLAWEAIETTGGARFSLVVEREPGSVNGGEPPLERVVRTPSAGELRLRLSADGTPHAPTRLLLRALGEAGELRVRAPRLHLPELRDPIPAVATAEGAVPAAPAAAPPNLVVYLIDTLRADRLGCYGHPKPTSPAIDRFAASAVRWREARAQAPWTRPAVATLLTGLYPVTHGAEQRGERIAEEIETVAESLRAHGYTTAMFTPNANTVAEFGFDQGWDEFRYLYHSQRRSRRPQSADEVGAVAIDWLDRRDRSKPFFLFVHTMDPHDAYVPREEFRLRLAPGVDPRLGTHEGLREVDAAPPAEAARRAGDLLALYDGEIAQNDAAFDRFLAALAERGVADDTAVLLTSDHGEEFFEHGGWRHGWTLHEEQLRIPMILRLPAHRAATRVLPGPVEQVDVAPTLLELAGVPPQPGLPGRSLLADLDGRPRPARESFAWLRRSGLELASVLHQEWKLMRLAGERIESSGRAPFELYALGSDPAERRELARAHPLRRAWLAATLERIARRHGARGPRAEVGIAPELDAALRALGYL